MKMSPSHWSQIWFQFGTFRAKWTLRPWAFNFLVKNRTNFLTKVKTVEKRDILTFYLPLWKWSKRAHSSGELQNNDLKSCSTEQNNSAWLSWWHYLRTKLNNGQRGLTEHLQFSKNPIFTNGRKLGLNLKVLTGAQSGGRRELSDLHHTLKVRLKFFLRLHSKHHEGRCSLRRR